jgi:signal peptidase I
VRWFKELGIVIVAALVLSALVRAFVAQAFFVPSASMEDTLMIEDRILASTMTTRMTGISRGEVIVFRDPGGWLPDPPPPPDGLAGVLRNGLTFVGLLPSDSGQDLVKRVIGVGGDRVQCCDDAGQIVLNGVPLDEDYIKGPTDQVTFDVQVPQGTVFVMGDNRGNSRDSRYHLEVDDGGVPVGNVVGRVFLVVWPIPRISMVPIPEIYSAPAIEDGPGGQTGEPGQGEPGDDGYSSVTFDDGAPSGDPAQQGPAE